MATHTGSAGLVKVGSNTAAEIRSFTLDTSAEVLEDTTLDSASAVPKSHKLESVPRLIGTEKNPLALSAVLKVKVLCTLNGDIKTFSGSMFFLNDIV